MEKQKVFWDGTRATKTRRDPTRAGWHPYTIRGVHTSRWQQVDSPINRMQSTRCYTQLADARKAEVAAQEGLAFRDGLTVMGWAVLGAETQRKQQWLANKAATKQ